MRKFWMYMLAIQLPLGASAMEWSSGSWLWNSSELLPVGKSHISISHQSRSANKRLNEKGRSENIGRRSKQVTERDGQNYIREFEIKMDYERWSPTWAYGLDSEWTLMAMLPLTRLRSNISERISTVGGVSTLKAPNQGEALKTFKQESGVQIAEAGEYSNMRVGRFELRSKHRVFSNKWFKATMFETLKFPTLEKTQVDFVAFADPLPRNFGSALGLVLDAGVTKSIDFVLSSEFLYQFPDKVYGRQLDGMPTPETVDRNPGAEFASRVGAEYEAEKNLTVSAGYSLQAKEADDYKDFSNIQETNPSEKHSVYVGLAYLPGLRNTRRMGQKGFSAALGYEALIQGENVEDADTLNVEVQMTF